MTASEQTPQHLLVVEDELHLAEGLRFNLQAEGYLVDLVHDGDQALDNLLSDNRYHAVVLDVMLPGTNGFDVVRALRKAENYVPVLLLTARSRPEDVLEGFAAGADDYLAKPFDLSILLARLNGLLRRMKWHTRTEAETSHSEEQEYYDFADRRIDFSALELQTPERTIHLTLMEADLLRYLVQNAGRIISRKELLEEVWHLHEDTDTRAIDNFIVRLRRYMEDEPSHPVFLQTVRGVGYRFLPDGTRE
jgi:DNA-binding response OmpR family regulator